MGKPTTVRFKLPPQYCLEGCLLVAAPSWQHDLYSQSVCLVVEHSPEKAVGVFLNHRYHDDTASLWKHIAGSEPARQETAVNIGGPASGPIIAIHDQETLADQAMAGGVFISNRIESLKKLVSAESDATVRIVLGQADWERAQLDTEFSEGKWIPLPITPEVVFEDEQTMWLQAMRQIGNRFVASITGAKGLPQDVLCN